MASRVYAYQMAGPERLNTARFDFVAAIALGTTEDQFWLMLRNLLIVSIFRFTTSRRT